MESTLILVNSTGDIIGQKEKMAVHRDGDLHLAFSVMIFNTRGEVLLQKRAKHKYHSGGLWTNATCGHPGPGDDFSQAAKKRLSEEMGLSCSLRLTFDFKYKVTFENGLIENEWDYVFAGITDLPPVLNREEAEDFKYLSLPFLKKDIQERPTDYTVWFRQIIALWRDFPQKG